MHSVINNWVSQQPPSPVLLGFIASGVHGLWLPVVGSENWRPWILHSSPASHYVRSLVVEIVLLPLLLVVCCDRVLAQCNPENVPDLLKRATTAILADWNAFPGFAFVERDSEIKQHDTKVTTDRVFMIEGSDYYVRIATNDEPLTDQQQAEEHEKLLREVYRRSHETESQRRHRSDRYWKERNQTATLLQEYLKAFDFTFVGEEMLNGYSACVLDARPRLDYRPPNREAKILTGMQGRLWIENHSFHWLKAEAEVLKPVSILGVAVRVLPGTHMELLMAPVSPSLWLVSSFTVSVKASIVWMSTERSEVTSWGEYRPAAAALKDELARQFP